MQWNRSHLSRIDFKWETPTANRLSLQTKVSRDPSPAHLGKSLVLSSLLDSWLRRPINHCSLGWLANYYPPSTSQSQPFSTPSGCGERCIWQSQDSGAQRHRLDFCSQIHTQRWGSVLLNRSGEKLRSVKLTLYAVVRSESVRNIIRERRMLEQLNHPFLCNLRYSFQDIEYLYGLLAPNHLPVTALTRWQLYCNGFIEWWRLTISYFTKDLYGGSRSILDGGAGLRLTVHTFARNHT